MIGGCPQYPERASAHHRPAQSAGGKVYRKRGAIMLVVVVEKDRITSAISRFLAKYPIPYVAELYTHPAVF